MPLRPARAQYSAHRVEFFVKPIGHLFLRVARGQIGHQEIVSVLFRLGPSGPGVCDVLCEILDAMRVFSERPPDRLGQRPGPAGRRVHGNTIDPRQGRFQLLYLTIKTSRRRAFEGNDLLLRTDRLSTRRADGDKRDDHGLASDSHRYLLSALGRQSLPRGRGQGSPTRREQLFFLNAQRRIRLHTFPRLR